jgi:hypothetical protein
MKPLIMKYLPSLHVTSLIFRKNEYSKLTFTSYVTLWGEDKTVKCNKEYYDINENNSPWL